MAGITYTPITSTTLGSAQTSVTFSSIPSTYTNLVLVLSGNQASNSSTNIQFNSDTGNNYSFTIVSGNGTSATSERVTNNSSINITNTGYMPSASSTFNTTIVHIHNYANTTTYKTILSRAGAAGTGTDTIVGLWRSTSAITDIKFRISNGSTNINTGSTFTLYGITAA